MSIPLHTNHHPWGFFVNNYFFRSTDMIECLFRHVPGVVIGSRFKMPGQPNQE